MNAISLTGDPSSLYAELNNLMDTEEKEFRQEKYQSAKTNYLVFVLKKNMWNQEKRLAHIESSLLILEKEVKNHSSKSKRDVVLVDNVARPVLTELL